MIGIAKGSFGSRSFRIFETEASNHAKGLVPEIAFCLFLCKGIRKNVGIEEIAAQASLTYPSDFYTWVDGESVPDLALILLTLNEANSADERYVIGDWSHGWHLTKKGLRFAKDVERRKLKIRGN